jgi:hypothetical protein
MIDPSSEGMPPRSEDSSAGPAARDDCAVGSAASASSAASGTVPEQIDEAKASLSQLCAREKDVAKKMAEIVHVVNSRGHARACALEEMMAAAREERDAVQAGIRGVMMTLNALVNIPVSGGRNPTEWLPDELVILVMIFEWLPAEALLRGVHV